MTGNGNDDTDFPRKSLLTDWKVSKICKTFANNLSANIKLSKTQLSKIIQLGGFLDRFFRILLKTSLPLRKNLLKPPAKSVLITIGLTTTASAKDAGIQNKFFGSEETALVISKEEMEDTMKIVKSLLDNFKKSLRILFAGSLGNILADKGLIWSCYRAKATSQRQGQGVVRVGQNC